MALALGLAIVVGSYANACTTVLLSHFYIEGPIGKLGWDKAAAREIVSYGRWILVVSSLCNRVQ